jgi:hypothetical protein
MGVCDKLLKTAVSGDLDIDLPICGPMTASAPGACSAEMRKVARAGSARPGQALVWARILMSAMDRKNKSLASKVLMKRNVEPSAGWNYLVLL